MAPDDPQPIIVIPVAIAPGTPVGSLANTAMVTNASDPNPDNNTVTDEGAVSEPQFDLSLVKDVTSSPVPGVPGYFPGAQITYELRITNNGTQPAPDVRSPTRCRMGSPSIRPILRIRRRGRAPAPSASSARSIPARRSPSR